DRCRDLVPQVRSGKGPWFLEVITYRWKEHVGPGEDYDLGFRDEQEAKPWIENDQVRRLADLLEPAARAQIEAEVDTEIATAFDYAKASPFPAAAQLTTDIFKEESDASDAFTGRPANEARCRRAGALVC